MSPKCYLIHFDETFGQAQQTGNPYVGARHYLGLCLDGNVSRRFLEHINGRGSKLVKHVVDAGIGIEVVRTWPGSWPTEKRLKSWKDADKLCPICNPRRRRNRTRKWRLRYAA